MFSEGLLTAAHGTGAIFSRNFAAYPADRLENWFVGQSGDPLLARTFSFNAARWPAGNCFPPTIALAKLWNRLLAPLVGRQWSVPVDRAAVAAAARARGSRAALVYAIVYSRPGLDVLAAALAGLGRPVPVILQLQDFFPSAHLGFRRALRRLRPHVAAVWAVSDAIARYAGPALGRPVQVDPLFNLELPAATKRNHRAFNPGFDTVVLGNFWQPVLLADLKAAWGRVQARLPGLGPVRWHCHPAGVERVRAAGCEPGPEVEPAPFLTGADLFARLQAADLAVIPFSRHARATTDYERYSLPSRITELAAAGLPIAGLTGPGTPLHEYLSGRDIGRCAPAAATAAAADLLETLVRDQPLRARLGTRARALAEREFPLERQQARLYAEFARLARAPVA
ncbi:MAG: hypothetical protein JNG83_12730 [Opitutaceae bacterium]|nr:hypothetical protein [Opitutaceae bacterium]